MQQKIVDADQGKLNFTFCSLFLFVYGNSVLTRNSAFHFLKSLVWVQETFHFYFKPFLNEALLTLSVHRVLPSYLYIGGKFVPPQCK